MGLLHLTSPGRGRKSRVFWAVGQSMHVASKRSMCAYGHCDLTVFEIIEFLVVVPVIIFIIV